MWGSYEKGVGYNFFNSVGRGVNATIYGNFGYDKMHIKRRSAF